MISGPRIIAGAWRGRNLAAPAGTETRPTNARARQAMFDILLHAPWAGRGFIEGARALDVFAGTGALGLEFLSRGGAAATFIETAAPALAALRANVRVCKAEGRASVLQADALRPPPGTPHGIVFIDPPYGRDLVPTTLAALGQAGWLARGALIVAELGPEDRFRPEAPLAMRRHGQAQLLFWTG